MCSQHVSPWPLNMILHRNFETIVAGVLPIPGYGGIDLSARKYIVLLSQFVLFVDVTTL